MTVSVATGQTDLFIFQLGISATMYSMHTTMALCFSVSWQFQKVSILLWFSLSPLLFPWYPYLHLLIFSSLLTTPISVFSSFLTISPNSYLHLLFSSYDSYYCLLFSWPLSFASFLPMTLFLHHKAPLFPWCHCDIINVPIVYIHTARYLPVSLSLVLL